MIHRGGTSTEKDTEAGKCVCARVHAHAIRFTVFSPCENQIIILVQLLATQLHYCTVIVVLLNVQNCVNVSALLLSGDDNENKSRLDSTSHTSGKRKKKKRRRKDEGSSDSDTEHASPQRDIKNAQSSLPRLVEELPDIIPKQVKSYKMKGKTMSKRDIMCKYSLIDLN